MAGEVLDWPASLETIDFPLDFKAILGPQGPTFGGYPPKFIDFPLDFKANLGPQGPTFGGGGILPLAHAHPLPEEASR